MASLNSPGYQYVTSAGWSAVTAWAASTAVSAGALRRQLATPTVGNERVFVATVGGTTGATEPPWPTGQGAPQTDNTVTWFECTGDPAVNGDAVNTPPWTGNGTTTGAKNRAISAGQIIKNDSGTHYFMCTTAGTAGNGTEPPWNTTAGSTTTDNTVTWTCLGTVGSFSAWGAPHARLGNAFASGWSVAADVFYVGSNHAETQSTSLALTTPGTANAINTILCTPTASAPPTSVTTGASITTTGASAITITGASNRPYAYYRGITFNVGTGATAANMIFGASNRNGLILEQCALNLLTTATGSHFQFFATAAQDALIRFVGCDFRFSNASQGFHNSNQPALGLEIVGGTIAATGTAPSILFKPGTTGTSAYFQAAIRGVNLSNVTGTLLQLTNSTTGDLLLANCRLGAGVAMTTGSYLGPGGFRLRLHNCDSAANNYRFYEGTYLSTIQHETTIVNNAGATDGTTRISWNIATSANTRFGMPYVSPEIAAWNDDTGVSKTATIEIAGANTLTNADIWLELEFLGSSTQPLATVTTNRAASQLATPANHTSSSATWSGSPAVRQRLSVTFTPQMKGPVKARVYVARPSTNVYVDPLLTIT